MLPNGPAYAEKTSRNVVTVDVADWSRLPEVVAYASKHGITVEKAIRMLVNAGLSHQ